MPNVLWTGVLGVVTTSDGLALSGLQVLAPLIGDPDNVEPGMIGAIRYHSEVVETLVETSQEMSKFATGVPIVRFEPISDDEWLAMPESLDDGASIQLFRVVKDDSQALEIVGALADPQAGLQEVVAGIVSGATALTNLFKRYSCRRDKASAGCRPHHCPGVCRTYRRPVGDGYLTQCFCQP